MKRLIALLSLVAFSTTMAFADPATIIKQKAKGVSNQNNARQGVASQPQRAPAPARPYVAPQTAPASPAAQQSVSKLQADFADIKAKPEVTAAQKEQLIKDLLFAARGTKKPSQTSVVKLGNDLSAALAGKPFSAVQLTRLAQNIHVMLNSALLAQTQKQAIADDVQAILKSAGASPAETSAVAEDLKAILAEIRP